MIRELLAILLLSTVPINTRADWPEFRGPYGNGHVVANDQASSGNLPLTWSETENVRWKTPVPHRGWSTPVVRDGKIWLTTATEDGHDFFAVCVDAESGEVLHNKKLFHCDEPEPLGNHLNCYAAPSPAIEKGRVYVHFGSYGTACLDTATGEILWQRDDLPCRHYRGPSSSVVLFENLVILTLDGVDLQYTIALDKQTGDTVWKTIRDVEWNDQNLTGNEDPASVQRIRDGDHRKAHCTPLIVTTPDGRTQMISPGAKAAFAYDPRTGDEIWRIDYDDFSVAPRPVFHDGIAYLVTGITHPELWAIRLGPTGNLTDSDTVLWRLNSRVSKTASPLLVDGLIYMISDDGIVNCIDAATGDPVWQKRIGGAFAASPIYAAGRIYFCNQDGETTVLAPGRKFKELATNTLDDGCMASPAVDGDALILRTKTHLYRLEDSQPAGR
ncbi:MAG: PQQ-binding-like beta-propeller repeat protein [Planctomycetes bacterium]|nr:PQQ-binding-like beta-propeller repeat protein [Planctomycetota bacterium]